MATTDSYADSWNDKRNLASTANKATNWFVELIKPAIMTRGGPRKQIHRTAYLDGLRGFAAFLVYWQHHQLWPLRHIPANRILENAYGFEDQYYFAAMPFVRTFFTGGHFSVAVFFVISGYVLSAKPLALIYAGDYIKFGDNVASALFRRWTRLHIPIILVTFVYMTSWHLFGIWTLSPDHQPDFRSEFWNWYQEFKNFSFVFRSGGEAWFTYNFPTWSIPVEFRGSIVIYTCLISFSRATRNARLWCTVGLIFYFTYIADGWFCAMFLAGMLLGELDLLARNDNLPQFFARFKRFKTPIFYAMFIFSIILGGCPSHINDIKYLREGPGWYYLSFLKPNAMWDQKWFFLFWGAVLLIASVPRIGWLKAFFETSFNQYLGRISFSLYLVHGPVLWILADRLYAGVGWYKQAHEANLPNWINTIPLSKSGPLGLEPAFLVPQLLILPVTLWLSEIVTKLCDEPSNRFAHWTYQIILGTPRDSVELLG